MPLTDPFALVVNRPGKVVESRIFRAVYQGQPVELALTLRGLDAAEGYVVQDAAFGYAAIYASPDPDRIVPINLGGKPIAMSFQLCNAAARVMTAQEGAERYTFEQICAWVVILGDAWNDVISFADELDEKVKALGKGTAKD